MDGVRMKLDDFLSTFEPMSDIVTLDVFWRRRLKDEKKDIGVCSAQINEIIDWIRGGAKYSEVPAISLTDGWGYSRGYVGDWDEGIRPIASDDWSSGTKVEIMIQISVDRFVVLVTSEKTYDE